MADVPRTLPSLHELDTRPFWEATKQHELRYQVCNACNGVVFYTRRHCPHCMSFDLRWETSKGDGAVYSFTIVRQIGHPFFRERAPYVVALVDLDEGFRLLTHVMVEKDAVDSVSIGQRVRLTWEDYDEVSLPVFEPA
jgi:uncharacterized OB-fold protein